jgi:hypothetical protein
LFKSKLLDIKKECYDEMNKKYLNIMKEKMKEIHKTILKDVQEQNHQILNNYVKKFEELEEKRESDYNQMSKLMVKNPEEKEEEIVFSMVKVPHHGIKCDKCGINPIIGYRYKCSVCNNYNLCENCEMKNYETKEHQHNFIKIRKEEKKVKKEVKPKKGKDKKKEIKIEEKKENPKKESPKKEIIVINELEEKYDYELITNKQDLSSEVNQFTVNEIEYKVMLKNNGNLEWPANRTKLINDKDSDIKCEDIILNNLHKDENQTISIKLKFNEAEEGMKKCIFHFSVDNINYGEPLSLYLNIKEDELLKSFREEFNLSKNDFPNDMLRSALNKNNNDKGKAFESLFQ